MFQEEIQIQGKTYFVGGMIGQGSMGSVASVVAPDNRKYAVKKIINYGRNPIYKEQVNRQIEVQRQFNGNPFIIQIYASQVKQKTMYILFQLGTCSLRRLIQLNTHIEFRQFLDLCLDTTKGLNAIHMKQMIHRDIKPENIICVEKTYKITDFGSLQSGTVGENEGGTPLYLAPQMLFCQGQTKYTQKIDVWSLGVTLFQSYFRIHPFCYLSRQQQDHKKIYEELKRNIKTLLPSFTMKKWLKHIQNETQLISKQKWQKINNIMMVTPQEMTNQFQLFFRYQQERPDIGFIGGMYQSLVDLVHDIRPKNVKLCIAQKDIPFDVRFYTQTLNIFYDLSRKYGTSNYHTTEFHLELGLWFWNYYNYYGQKYVQYSTFNVLKDYKKDKKILWLQVKKSLYNYWLEITTNKDLQFYKRLDQLKIRILLCGAMFSVNPQMPKFLKKVSQRVEMEVQTFEMFTIYLSSIFEIHQIRKIEEILTDYYQN